MPGLLEGRVGLVTGAATGIGRGSAMVCASEGATVYVADLPSAEAGGQETVQLIEKEGGKAAFIPCDVTKAADQERLVGEIVQRHGRLDFAHNNAGIIIHGLITELPEEDFLKVMAVNVTGVFLGLKYQIRQMAEQESGGAIVNTSSLGGLNGSAVGGAYNTSKHAVIGLTKTAAIEWIDYKIRINVICPGTTWTGMIQALSPERQDEFAALLPMKRFADPTEQGNVVAWLCSDRASYITGIAIPVDGGKSLGMRRPASN